MPNGHDILMIGPSSSRVEALMGARRWSADDIFCGGVRGRAPLEESPSILTKILNRYGFLEAVRAKDGERVEKRHIYVALSSYHMLLENGRVRVACGPEGVRHRPAADPLFRSVAVAYGLRG